MTDLSTELYFDSVGERKQGEERSYLGIVMEWRRSKKASCTWRCCNLSPIVHSIEIFFWIVFETVTSFPRGAPRRNAYTRVITLRFGNLAKKDSRMKESLQMNSNFHLLRQRPNLAAIYSTLHRSSRISSELPPIVPSSRYQVQNSDFNCWTR